MLFSKEARFNYRYKIRFCQFCLVDPLLETGYTITPTGEFPSAIVSKRSLALLHHSSQHHPGRITDRLLWEWRMLHQRDYRNERATIFRHYIIRRSPATEHAVSTAVALAGDVAWFTNRPRTNTVCSHFIPRIHKPQLA